MRFKRESTDEDCRAARSHHEHAVVGAKHLIIHIYANHSIGAPLLGTLLFTALTFSSFGGWIGLTALPLVYFAYLALAVLLYLLWVTLAKRWYVRRYHELL